MTASFKRKFSLRNTETAVSARIAHAGWYCGVKRKTEKGKR